MVMAPALRKEVPDPPFSWPRELVNLSPEDRMLPCEPPCRRGRAVGVSCDTTALPPAIVLPSPEHGPVFVREAKPEHRYPRPQRPRVDSQTETRTRKRVSAGDFVLFKASDEGPGEGGVKDRVWFGRVSILNLFISMSTTPCIPFQLFCVCILSDLTLFDCV